MGAKNKKRPQGPSQAKGKPPGIQKQSIQKPQRPKAATFSSGKAAKKRAYENAKRKPAKRAEGEDFETVPASDAVPDTNMPSESEEEEAEAESPEVIAQKYGEVIKLVLKAEELLEDEGDEEDDEAEDADAERKLREAKALLKRSLKILETVEGCALLAEVYLEEGTVEKAVLCLNRCIELDPDSPDAYSKLAEVMAAAGDLPQAIRYEKECVRLLEAACKAAEGKEKGGEEDEDDEDEEDDTAERRREVLVLHLLTLAEMHGEADDARSALACAKRAAEVAPESAQAALLHGDLMLQEAAPGGSAGDGPSPALKRAAEELRRGVRLCEEAGEEVPLEALRGLGEASLIAGDLAEAAARLKAASERAAAALDAAEKALEAAKRKRAKAKKDAKQKGKGKGKGKGKEAEGEEDEEEASEEAAAEAEVAGARAALAETLFMLGEAHRQRDEDAEAEAAWRGLAGRLEEGRERVHNSLALLCLAQGRHGDAEREIRAAVALAPDVPALHLTLGDVLLAAGRPADAKASFLKALDLDPDGSAGEALERVKACDAAAKAGAGAGKGAGGGGASKGAGGSGAAKANTKPK
eukprot:tig00020553_g10539.t1